MVLRKLKIQIGYRRSKTFQIEPSPRFYAKKDEFESNGLITISLKR